MEAAMRHISRDDSNNNNANGNVEKTEDKSEKQSTSEHKTWTNENFAICENKNVAIARCDEQQTGAAAMIDHTHTHTNAVCRATCKIYVHAYLLRVMWL